MRVRCATTHLIVAVDLNHQPRAGRDEVHDEATDDYLAAEPDTQLGGVDQPPQRLRRLPCVSIRDSRARYARCIAVLGCL